MAKVIPDDRPVTGQDIEDVTKGKGMSLLDAQWLFGLHSPRWNELVRRNAEEGVGRGTIALLARLQDVAPEVMPIQRPLSWSAFSDKMFDLWDLNEKELAVALGVDANAFLRWRDNEGMAPVTQHLMMAMLELALTDRENGKARYMALVETERQARGKTDPKFLTTGNWRPDKPKPKEPDDK